ncbi:ADP-ribosylglycohydrolase [Conyzicola lurida]|uniref:ADP-ribosylglycohydrolase n=1 Tax=Conyzicola lurida TaxID=1172621 RepID=A0A841ASX9_9MICO|nr:ADP-ribosylglycohydrolase family protein [Conyzicola lurida]MBB5844901.1 ADP-ribosylglycohydrolase [Conyzicola lurida]
MSGSEPASVGPSGRELVRLERASASILWSAWADALGFVSELVDERLFHTRTKGRPLTDTFAWTRRVGGKFGVAIELPAGTYSDDTQLRLATSRAVSGDGFDVEAFARIELTVWPAYALGGGRASRAAAANMTKSGATWSTNFFPGWTKAGGNGAAMRIQPHVWAARDLQGDEYLTDVIRNSIVTHGHPRALVGAVLHALSLAHALAHGAAPSQRDWHGLLERAARAILAFDRDDELISYWRPRWESETYESLDVAWSATVDECRSALAACAPLVEAIGAFADPDRAQSAADAYIEAGRILGLSDKDTRGSGTATVVASMVLAAALPDNPRHAAVLASSILGTDTDTIATMVAAVVGAATATPAPDGIQDRKYLHDEADRLTRVGVGRAAPKFSYPDILRWTPPHSQLDVVGLVDGRPALAGLGWLTFTTEQSTVRESAWAWANTSFGPSVLIKHRTTLTELPAGNGPRVRRPQPVEARSAAVPTKQAASRPSEPQPALFDEIAVKSKPEASSRTVKSNASRDWPFGSSIDIDLILVWLQRNGFSDSAVGQALGRIARDGTLEQMATFAGAVRSSLQTRR